MEGVAVGTGAVVFDEVWDKVLGAVGAGAASGVDVGVTTAGTGVDISRGLDCAPSRASMFDDMS